MQLPSISYVMRLLLAAILILILSAGVTWGQMRVVQSRHYTVHTDLPAGLAEDLIHRMDAMYDEYARRLMSFRQIGQEPRLNAYLFTRRDDYLRLVGKEGDDTAGVFIADRNYLAVVLEGSGASRLRQVLQHEAFHQFAHNRISPNMPVWLNEGLAELFEDGLWTGRGFIIGEVPPWRVAMLQDDMRQRRLIDFRTLMGWSLADWNRRVAGGGEVAAVQYNQAWGMVHFLVYATEGSGEPFYRDRLIDLLARLNRWQDPQSAFVAAFSDNIEGFEARFFDYARRLAPTDTLRYMDHVGILASLLRVTESNDFGTMAAFRSHVQRYWIAPKPRSDGVPTLAADPMVYFSYLNGQPMAANCLYFHPRTEAPLPDIVCEPMDHLRIRARFFHTATGEIDFDLLVEPL